MTEVVLGEDGLARCWWGNDPDIYRHYHDTEWGHPVTDDRRLFEKICLEGFQAGLSWLTILRKRDNFRRAFAGFDVNEVSHFDQSDVARLLDDSGIVRHQGKIRATINNAGLALAMIEERGSLASYFWGWAAPEAPAPTAIPATTATSTELSEDLKKRGWSFVGPTTIYAFMQAMGLVNDHLAGCHVRRVCAEERRQALGSRI